MENKVHCPYHHDYTASLHIYDDHAFCYGCQKRVTLEQLQKDLGKEIKTNPFSRRQLGLRGYREDIKKSIERIKTLPTKEIRGFNLRYDETGYYLVYPDESYYLKRMWVGNAGNKYKGPAGHRRPILKSCDKKDYITTLAVIEGEFNALSAICAFGPNLDLLDRMGIVSPGAASQFNSKELIDYCQGYDKIMVWVDKDAAGVLAGLELKEKLLTLKRRVLFHAHPKPDLNDIYVNQGPEEVARVVNEVLKLL